MLKNKTDRKNKIVGDKHSRKILSWNKWKLWIKKK